MQFLFDLFPVILFFAAFKGAEHFPEAAHELASRIMTVTLPETVPVLCATAVAVAATVLQLVVLKLRGERIKPMLWISFVVVTVFGGLTIYFQNELFIKWKPTILYFIFGGILLFGRLTNRNFVQTLLSGQLHMPQHAWHTLQWAWIGFFFATGLLNLVVAYCFSTDTWVNFKLFGLMGLTFIFTIAVTLYLAKYISSEQNGSNE